MKYVSAIGSVATVLWLAGCSGVSDPGMEPGPAARNAPWPTLLPMHRLIAGASEHQPDPGTTNAVTTEQALSRSHGLRNRARRLRSQPIIEPEIKSRMMSALARRP